MTELVLYTNPWSRGRIAHWMIEEAGQPFDLRWLDYDTTMKSPDYLALNPMGKVPTLVHGNRVVTEYAAICAYLADAFPAAGTFAPADRSNYYRWLFFGSGPLEAGIILRALGLAVPEDKRRMVGFRDVAVMLDAIEDALARHPYLGGDRFSAVDVATGSQIGWGLQFGTIEPRPALQSYWDRIRNRPARLRAEAASDAVAKGT